jgi:DNA polymerase-3 subunit delta
LGLIDSELSKLALFASDTRKVTDTQIEEVVGGWRTQTTWELLDAACAGNASSAMTQLDRLVHSGELPQVLFGAISWSLRRFAAAVRIVAAQERAGGRPDLGAALAGAGVAKFPTERFQQTMAQLRQIGRKRAGRLYRQLLAADLKIKGSHSDPAKARFVLEQLILALSSAVREPL